ncbi:uncharacterized protein LOC134237034 [Saccostrea cucullata]|uniref:uncharacterized protein LOC134237034 n=1 Tax=Saccostrea cuccullata TaxID=36930 RepID=UPI002ED61395
MDVKFGYRRFIWIVAVHILFQLNLAEACPPVKQQDLVACWNTAPCCVVEPSYVIDPYGFGCFRGCVRKCSRKNCMNPCAVKNFNLEDCINTDPNHCDVSPIMEWVKGKRCFSGCTKYCE